MKHITGEYAKNSFRVSKWFINWAIIIGVFSFVIVVSFAWGFFHG